MRLQGEKQVAVGIEGQSSEWSKLERKSLHGKRAEEGREDQELAERGFSQPLGRASFTGEAASAVNLLLGRQLAQMAGASGAQVWWGRGREATKASWKHKENSRSEQAFLPLASRKKERRHVRETWGEEYGGCQKASHLFNWETAGWSLITVKALIASTWFYFSHCSLVPWIVSEISLYVSLPWIVLTKPNIPTAPNMMSTLGTG